jgi:hypothetical protein
MTAAKPAAHRGRPRHSEPEQLVLWKKRGGKRRGAGRPPKGSRAGSPHKQRPYLHARYPVHVTLRVIGAVGNLHRRCVYHAIREATLTTALTCLRIADAVAGHRRKAGFRVTRLGLLGRKSRIRGTTN